jgi:hypothetical protein
MGISCVMNACSIERYGSGSNVPRERAAAAYSRSVAKRPAGDVDSTPAQLSKILSFA